ncbi:unnamed protein product [Lymnaea stagnalis]|uniref:Chitinase n=1 Tax=Lymnaea stagnalis TaxID=6523 RepID=A0AAV2HFX9_LYMST
MARHCRISTFITLCTTSFSLMLAIAVASKDSKDLSSDYKRVCYYTNWSQYRRDMGKFMPADIDPNVCTHLIFAFAKIDKGVLAPYEWNDLQYPFLYKQFNALKEKNPSLKTLLAVGGWTHGSQPFTDMVSSKASRQKFTQHAIEYLRTHDFDGLDLDWEYPANRGSPAVDRERFVHLVQELREAFEADAKKTGKERLLLTAAVPGGERLAMSGYDVKTLNKYVDFFNLMSYDLHGSWSPIIGHHAPLLGGDKWFESKSDSLNVEQSVDLWLKLGAEPQKLVMGLALYGKTFKLCTKGTEPGDKGCGAANPDTMNYFEILQRLKAGKLEKKWLDNELVPYAYSMTDRIWVGYDDEESLRAKVNLAKKKHLAGVMVWSIDGDDFSGKFGDGVKYPLMNVIKDTIEGKETFKNVDSKDTKKLIESRKEELMRNLTKAENEFKPFIKEQAPNKLGSFSELEREFFKPMAVPLRANMMAAKIIPEKLNDSSIVNTPENKEINITIYNTGTQLRQRLKQKNQDGKLRKKVEISLVPLAKTESPKIPVRINQQANQRIRGQHKRLSLQDKNSSSVYKRPQDSVYHFPTISKYSAKTNQSDDSSVNRSKNSRPMRVEKRVLGMEKVSGEVPWFTDKDSNSLNNPTAPPPNIGVKGETSNVQYMGVKTKLRKRAKSTVSNVNSVPYSNSLGGVVERTSAAKKEQGKGVQDKLGPSFGKFVSLLPEEREGLGTTIALNGEGPEWVTRLMAESGKEKSASKSAKKQMIEPKLAAAESHAIPPQVKKDSNKVYITASSPRQPNERIATNSHSSAGNPVKTGSGGDNGKVYIKASRPSSVHVTQVRSKAPRRHYIPTPYKSMSPFSGKKNDIARIMEKTPMISKYSSRLDDELPRMRQRTEEKSGYKYKLKGSVPDNDMAELKQEKQGKIAEKWWDSDTTTSTQTMTILQQRAEPETKASGNIQPSGENVEEILIRNIQQTEIDPRKSWLSKSDQSKEKKDKSTPNPVSSPGYQDKISTQRLISQSSTSGTTEPSRGFSTENDGAHAAIKEATTEFMSSTQDHLEYTTHPPLTSSKSSNIQYKSKKPWWTVTSTNTDAPRSYKNPKKHAGEQGFPKVGRKYQGDVANTLHKDQREISGILATPTEKGSLDISVVPIVVVSQEDIHDVAKDLERTLKADLKKDNGSSKIGANLGEQMGSDPESKLNMSRNDLRGDKRTESSDVKLNTTKKDLEINRPLMGEIKSGYPEVQPYHAKLALQTLKNIPSPEKIYHYRHTPGLNEDGHEHQRVNKLAENEVHHRNAEQPPTIGGASPDVRDWSKIRDLLRNSTIVSEIKSKLDEIHKSVTRDLSKEPSAPLTTKAPEDIQLQRGSGKWFDRTRKDQTSPPAAIEQIDIVSPTPVISSNSQTVTTSAPEIKETSEKLIERIVGKRSHWWDSDGNKPKSNSEMNVAAHDQTNASPNETEIKQETFTETGNADPKEDANISDNLGSKTPKFLQNENVNEVKEVARDIKSANDANDPWWNKDSKDKSDNQNENVNLGSLNTPNKEESNLIYPNAPSFEEKTDATSEANKHVSQTEGEKIVLDKYSYKDNTPSLPANKRSNSQRGGNYKYIKQKSETKSKVPVSKAYKNSANFYDQGKRSQAKPLTLNNLRQQGRPRNYNGYIVNNYKRDGVKKNSAASNDNAFKYSGNNKKTYNSQSDGGKLYNGNGWRDSSKGNDQVMTQQKNVPENEAFQAKNTVVEIAKNTIVEIAKKPNEQKSYLVDNQNKKKSLTDTALSYGTLQTSDNFVCPSTFGIYADPGDCRMFYQCVWYVSFHHVCGRGTAWNQEERICDWPKRTDCLLPTDDFVN